MTDITCAEDCFECRTCCKFEKDHTWFAPKMTKEEYEAIMKHPAGAKANAEFRDFPGGVKQIVMIPSKREDMIYVCPFLDEDSHACVINDVKPFDCRFWPFLLMKGDREGEVDIMLYNEDVCPSLDKKSCEAIKAHEKEAMAAVSSPEMRRVLKENPELLWAQGDEDDEDVYRVGTVKVS